jgi:hypothetical protein
MATADLSGIAFFAPIAAFLLVFLVSFAIFHKTNILGESKWLNLFISLIISSLFVSFAGGRLYVQTIVPWIAIALVCLVFLLAILGFVGKDVDFMKKGVGIAFVVILGIIFLISAFFVFSEVFIKYIPGPTFARGSSPEERYFLSWLYSPRIAGAIILIVISAIVSWILVKK